MKPSIVLWPFETSSDLSGYVQLYSNKLGNLEEMKKLWETHNLPKLNHEN